MNPFFRPDLQHHFKSTLREMCLKAVIEHKIHLVLSRGEGLRNLRKKNAESERKEKNDTVYFLLQQLL
jgi:hypothetical protein